MEASAKGAKEAGGLTVGILPDRDKSRVSQYIDIAICTGMGDGLSLIHISLIIKILGKGGYFGLGFVGL